MASPLVSPETPGGRAFSADAALAWLSDAGFVRLPCDITVASRGHSAVTYLVTDAAGARLVVQRPQIGEGTVHDVRREYSVHTALHGTAIPVPRPIAYCEDTSIAGASFYAMAFVEGVLLDSASATEKVCPVAARPKVAEEYVRTLVAIHRLDIDDIGLGDLSRRTGYLERQLDLMFRLWQQNSPRDSLLVAEVHDELVRLVPRDAELCLVHGDYGLHNLLFDESFDLAAVLDWELATLGDPLADVALISLAWIEPRDPPDPFAPDATRAPGFPGRADVIRRYAELSGRDLSNLDYYLAFANWRSATIRDGLYARLRQRGHPEDERLASLLVGADRCLAAAAGALERYR